MQTASLVDIPHVHIGTCEGDVRTRTYICFPQLFRAEGSTTLLGSDREQLYNDCILPAIRQTMSNAVRLTTDRTHIGIRLPATWSLIKYASKQVRHRLQGRAITMDPTQHRAFLQHISQSLDQIDLFNDWFFVHVIETPSVSHSPTSDAEANSAWDGVKKLVSVRQTDRKDWKVLVGLHLRSDGNVTLIKSSCREALLASILPNVPQPMLEREPRRKHSIAPSYLYDGASTFQASTRHLEENQDVEHIYVQSQYSSPRNWALLSPPDLFRIVIETTQGCLRERLSEIRERILRRPQAREAWTSITILTSYAQGKNVGKIDISGLVEVIEGAVWWYVTQHKTVNRGTQRTFSFQGFNMDSDLGCMASSPEFENCSSAGSSSSVLA